MTRTATQNDSRSTAAASGPPSIPSLNLLDQLLYERLDVTLAGLDESMMPSTQTEASSMIDALRDKPALPTSEEQRQELLSFGIDPAEHPDRGSAGKVLYIARRRDAIENYHQARGRASEKLDAIFAQAGAGEPAAVA